MEVQNEEKADKLKNTKPFSTTRLMTEEQERRAAETAGMEEQNEEKEDEPKNTKPFSTTRLVTEEQEREATKTARIKEQSEEKEAEPKNTKLFSSTTRLMDEEQGREAEKTARMEELNEEKEDEPKSTKPFWTTRLMAEEQGREVILQTTLKETIFYLFFLGIVVTATVGTYTPSMYYLTRAMQKQFLETSFPTTNEAEITFSDIKTAADFWYYSESVLTDNFYWDNWYDNENPVKPTEEDDKKILYENKLIGVPRLRQLKVRDDSCSVHEFFQSQFYQCYGPYSLDNQDTSAFGPAEGTAWVYSSPEKLEGITFTGKLATYYAGGYYQDFGTDANATKEIINDLKDNLWITRGTRAIFLDFTAYNANLNLFSVVKLVFEFPPTGGVVPSSHTQTLHIIRYSTAWDYYVMGMEVLIVGFTLFYTAEEIRECFYFKLKYLRMFWNYIDVTILSLLYACIVLNILCAISRRNLESLIAIEDSYANFEPIADVLVTYNNVSAVLTFFVFIKLFKYISFNKTMGQLNNTIKNCALDVLGFSVMFFIIFIAFAELGYLLFGTEVESFSTFGTSMFTLLRTILGDFDYMEIERANRILAPVFFLSYIFFVFFVLLNMFLAIINDTYADVKTEIAIAPDELQMTQFVKRGLHNFLKKLGLRNWFRPNDKPKKKPNATIEKICDTLKKCGFSDPEIQMFLQRYNIDPAVHIGEEDVQRLLQKLESSPTQGNSSRGIDDGVPVVRLTDFEQQQERLNEVEKAVKELSKLTRQLIDKLDNVASVTKRKIQ